mmetsp:Transcript_12366/g.26548  ORF Transcript_12366/g.26548 Transcript_12366/m.26548 type:complete len:211 (-) Transcript_12366:130-762(-)
MALMSERSSRSTAPRGFIHISEGASRVPSPGATAVRTRAARACPPIRRTCAVHWQLLTSCGAAHGVGVRLVWRGPRRRRLLRIRLDEAPLPRGRVPSVRCGRLISSAGTGLTRGLPGLTGLPRLRFPKAPPFPRRLTASARIPVSSIPVSWLFTKTSAALSHLVSTSCFAFDIIALATSVNGFTIPSASGIAVPVQTLPCSRDARRQSGH